MTLPKMAYTCLDASAATGLSPEFLKKAIHRGDLRAKRSGVDKLGEPAGKYLILAADLQAWLEGLNAA